MGYDLTIKIKSGELDKKFIPSFKSSGFGVSDVDKEITILTGKCIQPNLDLKEIYKDIEFTILYIKTIYDNEAKQNIVDRFNDDCEWCPKGSIHFCGWNNALDKVESDYTSKETLDRIIKNTISNVFYIACGIKDCDYWENSEKFWEKISLIEKEIKGLDEIIYDYWDAEFIRFYKDKTEEVEIDESY